MPEAIIPTVEILGIRVHAFTIGTLHEYIAQAIRRGGKCFVANVNVNALNLTVKNPDFRRVLVGADCVFCDGAGVMLAARLLGQRLPQRITYAHWLPLLARFCEQEGFSLFLLGGRDGVAAKAAAALQRLCPRLQMAGTHHGFFDKSDGSSDNVRVIELINAARPHILLVSLGMPLQELWLDRCWKRLDMRVALTGGGALDYVSGELRRPPRWMTDHGLEWLGRLLIEPRRLWKRYLIGNPLFISRVLRERFFGKRIRTHPQG